MVSLRPPPTFRHLALEGGWPEFQWRGLAPSAEGALELAPVPELGEIVDSPGPVPGFEGPVGIGVDRNGDVYFADAERDLVMRVRGCETRGEPLRCLGGRGQGPGQLFAPRGLLVGPRRSLYVADTGNHRVQIVDLETEQVSSIWGPTFADEPDPSGYDFQEPWDLAADSNEAIYVADAGTPVDGIRRGGGVRRFDATGIEDGRFAAPLEASGPAPAAPIGVTVAILPPSGEERVLVLDSAPARLLVFTIDGRFDADATTRWEAIAGDDPRALAFSNGVLYVAASAGRVVAFDAEGRWLGMTGEPGARVATLAIDCAGRLLARIVDGVVRRASGEARNDLGSFVRGPIAGPREGTRWQRLRLDATIPPGTHLRLFTYVSETSEPAPALPFDANGHMSDDVIPADAPEDAALDRWRAAPTDADDLLVLHRPGRYLWIAGILRGDGRATPRLRQIRVENDRVGALGELPALYRRDPVSRRFLDRALAVFESTYRDERAALATLPELFDAYAAPSAEPRGGAWLDALATWVDARPAEEWTERMRRERVATAFESHAERGTPASLRAEVRRATGATIHLDDASSAPDPWQLGAGTLGFGTALAPDAAQGAVVGTTATLERSRLLRESDRGRPIWEDDAHRFRVKVLTAGAPPGVLDRVREVLDREKPAHTVYELCAIEPRMRVGHQARLGVDAIVAGPAPPARLGADPGAGGVLRLQGRPLRDTVGETWVKS